MGWCMCKGGGGEGGDTFFAGCDGNLKVLCGRLNGFDKSSERQLDGLIACSLGVVLLQEFAHLRTASSCQTTNPIAYALVPF